MGNLPEPSPDRRRDLRVSHQDRDSVAERLRDAAGDGRLDMDELDERLERAFAAKTYGELEPLVADLPTARTSHQLNPGVGGVATSQRSQAILSEHKRNGVWVVPPTYTATAVLGSVELDLREATFAEPEVVISCVCLMGEIKIRVGEDVVVVEQTNAVLGECNLRSSKGLAPMPERGRVLRVRGTAFMGSINIERLAPGERRPHRFWH